MNRKLKIKDLAPRANSVYKQGYYHLFNSNKYIGDPAKVIFRSSYEQKFASYCDLNDRVIAWSSEPFEIKYMHPIQKKIKPYNVDFYVKIQTGEDTFNEYLVEVKPLRQLQPPSKPVKRLTEKKMTAYTNQLKTYMINLAKFDAAKTFANNRGWEFIVVTEKFLL